MSLQIFKPQRRGRPAGVWILAAMMGGVLFFVAKLVGLL